MTVQITGLFRQGVVRPLDREACEKLLSFFVDDTIRCEWLPIIDEAHFSMIWKSGLFKAIEAACDIRITDYAEIVLDPDQIENARDAVIAFLDENENQGQRFATCLRELLCDALRDKMPVVFVL